MEPITVDFVAETKKLKKRDDNDTNDEDKGKDTKIDGTTIIANILTGNKQSAKRDDEKLKAVMMIILLNFSPLVVI